MQTPYFVNDATGYIFGIFNYFDNSDSLIDFSSQLTDGISFTRTPGKRFDYRGTTLAPLPVSDSVVIGWLFQTLEANNILGTAHNLVVFNKITAGQNPALSSSDVNELAEGSRIVLINTGPLLAIQLHSGNNSTANIPLKTGDMLAFDPVPNILTNNSYEFIITDSLPRSIITFVVSNVVNNYSNNSIRPTTPMTEININKSSPTPSNKLIEYSLNVPSFGGSKSKNPISSKPAYLDIGEGKISKQPLTKFELTKVIGERAKNISDNFPILIDYGDENNSVIIASMELEAAKTNPDVREGLSYIQIVRCVDNKEVLVPISQLI